LDNDFAPKNHTHSYAAPSHTHTIANITDLRTKNGVATGITTSNPYQSWAHADVKSNDIIFGGDYSGHTTTDANIVFSSGSGKINMIIDGEYYAMEGKQRVYHTGYKPSPSDIGAAASSHGTHVTYATATPKAHGTAAVGTSAKVAREDHVHPLQASAATWTTARTLTIGNKGKSVNGSANVSWTLAEIGALPLTGGTLTGQLVVQTKEDGTSGLVVQRAANTDERVTMYVEDAAFNVKYLNDEGASSIKFTLQNTDDEANAGAGANTATATISGASGKSTIAANYFTESGTSLADKYAAKSHGTHVTWSTTAPKVPGTAAVGTETKAARGDHVHAAQTSVSGNAGTATKLKTARTLTIGNTGKDFDGSANVSWTLDDIGAVARYTAYGNISAAGKYFTIFELADEYYGEKNNYLLSINRTYNSPNNESYIFLIVGAYQKVNITQLASKVNSQLLEEIRVVMNTTNASSTKISKIEVKIKDNPSYTNAWNATLTPLSYNARIPVCHNFVESDNTGTTIATLAPTTNGMKLSEGGFNGNASTATKAGKWSTARTLTIGNKGQSVDGSGNVTWSLSDIGAQSTKRSINFIADHTSNWTSSSAMSGLTYAGGWHGSVGSDGYLSFGNSGGNIVHMFIDGDYYARENKKVFHEGNLQPTVAKLTTARTLTIGSKGKAFDGSGNVSWTLAEIGALPTAGGTMTGAINRASFPSTWVAAMTNSFITSTHGTAGGFQPMLAGKTNNGSMCLGFYQKTLQAAYITKANVDAGTNTTAKTAILMDESGNGSWSGSVTATGGFTSGGNIVSDTALTDNIGSAEKPWKNMYNRYYNLYGEASKSYGNFFVQTVGTTSATGEARLTLGNNIATGTASNAYGRLLLYGTNTGYTIVAPGNNTTSNITVNLPSSGGTLARTADNVASATKLKTARTLTIGSKGKTFDGSADVSWTLAEIGAAAASHNHDKIVAASGSAWTTAAQNPGAGDILFHYNISKSAAGLFPNTNNANLIISLNRHSGNYSCQLGFNNEGNIYYRGENNVAISDTMKWKEIAFNGIDSSLVDATTVGRSGSGKSTADTYASTGKCYKFTSTSTATTIYKCTFAPLHFGSYGLCVRLKASAKTSTSNIIQIIVYRGTKALKTVSIKGTQFTSTSQYQNFYTNIDYVGDGSAKVDLSVEIKSTTVSGIDLSFDYARIEMMNTGVFL
jgi:hypothetical protein